MTHEQEPDHPEDGPEIVSERSFEPSPRRVPPGLHLVATPIGTARDITLRTLDILAGADVLAAEDTRSLRRLMEIHGIRLEGRPLLAYHDHNGGQMRPRLMAALAEGKSVAFAPEAGTPLISDPGFQLARTAIDQGHSVVAAPGASAVLAALAVGGLPTDRFCFMGFAPSQGAARKRFLAEAAQIPATLAFYESPKRVHRLLTEIAETLGAERDCALCRELTKRFEEVVRGTVAEVAAAIEGRALKGEIVLLVGREAEGAGEAVDLDDALSRALEVASLREAVDMVTAETGLKRRAVYQRALALREGKDE
ncbi:16S rRNA (cytidine(1402)-2'-O)-methyltransferase [Pararhodobacter oceanensis]|uniref:Ribosomal RNA small subunit methyltransferase I n=1 Tax=Pararhodobacter oceanensis TaxID=2172121 RepID=A0A2T8HUW3_9RHOB|nr:16S rRNA (cytidine(1402)-2'-O)-methyltransferase [Pararhodobacter oceanensis]PVH29203.1 16S rRNA (cytidine(1402)-2'-O)-methyltransferase [Pararhodobacter oceanensis]